MKMPVGPPTGTIANMTPEYRAVGFFPDEKTIEYLRSQPAVQAL
jgi:aconitase A